MVRIVPYGTPVSERILKSEETGQNQNLEQLWIDYCINSWTGKIILVKSLKVKSISFIKHQGQVEEFKV